MLERRQNRPGKKVSFQILPGFEKFSGVEFMIWQSVLGDMRAFPGGPGSETQCMPPNQSGLLRRNRGQFALCSSDFIFDLQPYTLQLLHFLLPANGPAIVNQAIKLAVAFYEFCKVVFHNRFLWLILLEQHMPKSLRLI